MSNYERCSNCGEYGFTDTHQCKPKWRAYIEDYDWPIEKVHARDAEQAAEKAVAMFDSGGEYTVCGNSETVTVQVQQEDNRPVNVEVTGQMIPDYMGTQL